MTDSTSSSRREEAACSAIALALASRLAVWVACGKRRDSKRVRYFGSADIALSRLPSPLSLPPASLSQYPVGPFSHCSSICGCARCSVHPAQPVQGACISGQSNDKELGLIISTSRCACLGANLVLGVVEVAQHHLGPLRLAHVACLRPLPFTQKPVRRWPHCQPH